MYNVIDNLLIKWPIIITVNIPIAIWYIDNIPIDNIPIGIFHRTRTNNLKISMKTEKTSNSQNTLDKKGQS